MSCSRSLTASPNIQRVIKGEKLSKPVLISANTSWYLYNFRGNTIKALLDAGHRVLCVSPNDAFSFRLVDELGAEHISIPLAGKSTGLLQELCAMYAIWRLIRRYKPVFVFNFTIKLNVYSGLVCAVQKVPFANNVSGLGTVFIHNSWLFRRVRQLYGFVCRRAVRVFFQNEEDLRLFQCAGLLGGTTVTLLPGSGVDLLRFAFQPLPRTAEFTFLMIARLLGDKGVREYAGACLMLKQRGVHARCLLVGSLGADNVTAISESEVLGWQQEQILEYRGAMDDVRPAIAESHVIVLPSYREGMPRVVLEGAAMGRPAIVSDVPGCRQAIETGKTGWLCAARSASSLAEQMINVINTDRAYLEQAGKAARERMEKSFGEEKVVAAYLACIPAVK